MISSNGAGGRFIVFEGGEGAGKTTQLQELATRLLKSRREIVLTREPGGTMLGRRIRELVLDKTLAVSPRTEALLFAADRATHVETIIRPALARGAVVLCDRYVDSSIAYQGAGRGLGRTVEIVSAWATDGLKPDLTVLLDVEPLKGLTRAQQRGGHADRIERAGIGFHDQVQQAFLARAQQDPDRYLVLEALTPVNVLADAVEDRVRRMLHLPAKARR